MNIVTSLAKVSRGREVRCTPSDQGGILLCCVSHMISFAATRIVARSFGMKCKAHGLLINFGDREGWDLIAANFLTYSAASDRRFPVCVEQRRLELCVDDAFLLWIGAGWHCGGWSGAVN